MADPKWNVDLPPDRDGNERHALIASDDEITVDQQWELERAIASATAASLKLARITRRLGEQLEANLTAGEKKELARLRSVIGSKVPKAKKEAAQAEIDQLTQELALQAGMAAWEELTRKDQDAIDHVEAVRVLVFLRAWDLKDDKGKPRPIPASFDEVRQIPGVVMKAISAATLGVPVEQTNFNMTAEALRDPKVPPAD